MTCEYLSIVPLKIPIFTSILINPATMRKLAFTAILILAALQQSSACSTAIVSGKATPDGRPLLWKHRDTDNFNNKMMFFAGSRYEYIGLVNSQDSLWHVWAGTNSAGFSIMNSASYNITPGDDKAEKKDLEGYIMKLALAGCATLKDFATLLDTLRKPLGVAANFGVIDALGGAAYFETNNYTYKVFDANDAAVAPNGYIIRTNFSLSGSENQGAGYNRYNTASAIVSEAYANHGLTPEFFLDKASLCLRHELTQTDLSQACSSPATKNRIFPFRDYIVRFYSSSTVVVQGVKPGESPLLATTWVKLGFQPASVAIPLWVGVKNALPGMLTAPGQGNAKLCDIALKLKETCFPYLKWAEGENYVLLEKLINVDNTGLIQQTVPFDLETFESTVQLLAQWRKSGFNPKEASAFYLTINKRAETFYSQNFTVKP
jgi:hypothetical protein